MKKVSLRRSLLLCMAVLAITLMGCTKEGHYKTKKKISKITTIYSGTTTEERWTWNNDLPSEIKYYRNGTLLYVDYFTYDSKKRISEIKSGNERLEYKYDGSNLIEINNYEDNILDFTLTFTHDGGQISQINLTSYDSDFKASGAWARALRHILPEPTLEHIKKEMIVANTKGNFTYTITFKWKDKNIVEQIFTLSSTEEAHYLYSHDKMKNPFAGWMVMDNSDYAYNTFPLSKNNILTVTQVDFDGDMEQTAFTYTYDDDYPTQRRCVEEGILIEEVNYYYE